MDAQSQQRPIWAYLSLVYVASIWGINFVIIKKAFNFLDPLAFIGVRQTLACVILLAFLLITQGWKSLSKRDWLVLFGLGLLANTIFQYGNIVGLHFSRPENAALIQGSAPIWAAIVAGIIGWDRVTPRMAFGIVLSFVSVAVVIYATAGGFSLEQSVIGDLLVLSSAIAWACYTVFSKELLSRHSALRVSTLAMIAGLPGVWLYTMPTVLATPWPTLNAYAIVSIVFSAVFAIALNYLIYSRGVQKIGPARTAIFNNMTPVVTFILSIIFLQQPIFPLQILGGLGVIAGVIITIRAR